jgi:ABC-type antimicrobial peptide transport system permease subunit
MLDERIARSTEQRKFSAQLLSAFAFSAVLLAILGIAGTTAYVVAQRTPEIAVRIAMGATFADVLRMILVSTLRIAIAGVVTGLLAAGVLSRAVQGLLYDISASDPPTLTGVAALMIF